MKHQQLTIIKERESNTLSSQHKPLVEDRPNVQAMICPSCNNPIEEVTEEYSSIGTTYRMNSEGMFEVVKYPTEHNAIRCGKCGKKLPTDLAEQVNYLMPQVI